jgi:hypothetical protein
VCDYFEGEREERERERGEREREGERVRSTENARLFFKLLFLFLSPDWAWCMTALWAFITSTHSILPSFIETSNHQTS